MRATCVLTLMLPQVWFDDAKSSGIKYGLAASMGLGGVGPYRFDQLDPSGARTGNPRAQAEAQSMWASLSSFDRPANW
jgi:spore germination protein YaaH